MGIIPNPTWAGCHQNEPPLGSPCLHFRWLTNKQASKQIPSCHPRVGKKSSGNLVLQALQDDEEMLQLLKSAESVWVYDAQPSSAETEARIVFSFKDF